METKVGPYIKPETDPKLEEKHKYQLILTLINNNSISLHHSLTKEELITHTQHALKEYGYEYNEKLFEDTLQMLIATGRIKRKYV